MAFSLLFSKEKDVKTNATVIAIERCFLHKAMWHSLNSQQGGVTIYSLPIGSLCENGIFLLVVGGGDSFMQLLHKFAGGEG